MRGSVAAILCGLSCAFAMAVGAPAQDAKLVVGSKNFAESTILGEVVAQLVEDRLEVQVERRLSLGGTMMCVAALESGEIDVYVEYTGTAWAIVLREPGRISDPLRAFLHVQRRYREERGLIWCDPFGFENSYGIAVPRSLAEKHGLRRISDLVPVAGQLRAGFSIEFMQREDGLPGLVDLYGLQFGDAKGVEHGLAYAAVRAGQLDVIDAYTTDGKLLRYDLRVLEDDMGYFPPYHAAPVVRADALARIPRLRAVLDELAYRLPESAMQELNDSVESGGATFADAARGFLQRSGLVDGDGTVAEPPSSRNAPGFLTFLVGRIGLTIRLVLEHLALSLGAVILATAVAVPVGIGLSNRPALRRFALGATGVLQTIPSLALLVLMIPLFGLSALAAVAALFLYALLPILRNTCTGLAEVDPALVDAARGLGMRRREILRIVQLPLASRTILAGVRTATVISVGVATLAGFMAVGGLGVPIFEGLYLNDSNLILAGAVPAALLAVLCDAVLGWLERRLAPTLSATGSDQ